jgi:methionyl aminopeptidase
MVSLKTKEEIEIMRSANRIVATVLERLRREVRPGISTGELDRIAEEMTLSLGARPAFKGYQVNGRTFPRSVCISINEEVVHGIPSEERILKEGDLVGLDFGVVYKGFYGDAAVTVAVGRADEESQRLMQVTERALWAGIAEIRAGRRLGEVSAAIQSVVETAGFSVVREFVGHGIGRRLHEDPQVPNFGERGKGIQLREGMVLAIEPMVNAGTPRVRILEDGWTAVTADGRRSAHFEHSVAVTSGEPDVLSLL